MPKAVTIIATRPADSWAWMRADLARLGLFLAAGAGVYLALRPRWLGVAGGAVAVQLAFGVLGAALLFAGALLTQAWLTPRRGALRVPTGGADLALQAGYYVLNGPLEELFFRGVIQGGLGSLFGSPIGFAVATAIYVLYHRAGGWTWPDVAATALLGVPLGLAFWLLPGPPSLLGVSIAHIGATCGFLGPGPLLLRKLRLV